MKFSEAMAAIEDGKQVQYWTTPTGDSMDYAKWIDFKLDSKGNITYYRSILKWRIKSEPVKYSVDIWFHEAPKVNKNYSSLVDYLIDGICWHNARSDFYNKKYRITVEEVEE